jgi:hypothetical protein
MYPPVSGAGENSPAAASAQQESSAIWRLQGDSFPANNLANPGLQSNRAKAHYSAGFGREHPLVFGSGTD